MIKNDIDRWVEEHKEEILAAYHHLHQIAEISWKEIETTKYISEQLTQSGITVNTFQNMTGLVGEWGNHEKRKSLGIRADMDALWQYVNGNWKANHSCGHDAHSTMLLFTMKCLKEIGFKPEGKLVAIFQPAEETGNGAKAIIKHKVIENLDALIGIHLRPIQEMPYKKASPAIYHGATTMLKGTVNGVQAHGARPHLGINVVDSISAIIQAVNSLKLDPNLSYSAKVTAINAGGENLNIIPDFAEFGIDVRAQTNEIMTELIEKVEHAVKLAGSVNGAKVEIIRQAEIVSAIPNKEMEKIVSEAIVDVLGEGGLHEPPITPGGEDFHFYPLLYPKLKATMIGLGTNLQPGLHHPQMTFELDSLLDGVKIISNATIKYFDL